MLWEEQVLGIDLAPGAVTIASLEPDGRARVLADGDGLACTPLLHCDDDGFTIVGVEALPVGRDLGIDPRVRLPEPGASLTWPDVDRLTAVLAWRHESLPSGARSRPPAVVALPGALDAASRRRVATAVGAAGFQVLSVTDRAVPAALGLGMHRADHDGPALVVRIDDDACEVSVLLKRSDMLTLVSHHVLPELGGDVLARVLGGRFGRALELAGTVGVPVTALRDAARAALAASTVERGALLVLAHGTQRGRMSVGEGELADLVDAWIGEVADAALGIVRQAGFRHTDLVGTGVLGSAADQPGVRVAVRARMHQPTWQDEDPATCTARGTALLGVLRHARSHPGLAAPSGVAEVAAGSGTPSLGPDAMSADAAAPALAHRHVASFQLADGGSGVDER